MATDTAPSVYETGSVAATGSFICLDCSFVVSLSALDRVPECPTCGGSSFRRASLFEQPTLSEQPPVESDPEEPAWLRRLRSETERQGQFLAFEDEDGKISTIPVPEGWTRIGRSITAEIRLDDPTVSRRHALIVKTDSEELRVLDDRSLNGLFVNGERVDWSPLDDGDELAIGRYRLHVIDTAKRRPPVNPEALQA